MLFDTLPTYFVPGPVLGTRNTAVNGTDRSLSSEVSSETKILQVLVQSLTPECYSH